MTKYTPRVVETHHYADRYVRWERTKDSFSKHRFLIHLPVGVLAAWLCYYSWAVGIPFVVAFLTYQVIEDWRIKDRSYKDALGFLFGFGATAASLVGYGIYLSR